MISHEDLKKLGYRIKTRDVNQKKGSNDYLFPAEKGNMYIINLTDGIAQIIFPINSNRDQNSFDKIEQFKEWHNQENGIV